MNEIISRLSNEAESFYLYDERIIRQQAGSLKSAFPDTQLLYSIKCNPNRHVLETVFSSGLWADAASPGEVRLAAKAGLTRDMIYYSVPGKTIQEIRMALSSAVIIADSISEISRISEAAGTACVDIGLRIDPGFSFDGGDPVPSKFGIAESDAQEYIRHGMPENIRITGIHVHLKSQELNCEKLINYYRNVLSLADRIEEVLGHELDFINMGSGVGIAYAADDAGLDMERLASGAREMFAAFKHTHPRTRLLIESGRYIVCRAGIYITHVADRKVSHGRTFIILKNTLNGFMRPSLACLAGRYTGVPSEPLYTSACAFGISAPYPDRSKETVTIAGDLCTASYIIAADVTLPRLEAGDIVIINNAGAYAATLSPVLFSSHPTPAEYFLYENGRVESTDLITRS